MLKSIRDVIDLYGEFQSMQYTARNMRGRTYKMKPFKFAKFARFIEFVIRVNPIELEKPV